MADGKLQRPVTIWVVRVGDDLYVRSWKERKGSWFRASEVRHEGHIQAGGVDKDVTFVRDADDDICVYPLKTTWNGTGSSKEAANYACR